MAFDATLGSTTQNSYVTLDEAISYFEYRPFVTSTWDDLSAEDQEKYLILGSHFLDWYIKWKGFRASSTQGMAWPRSNVILPNGDELASTVLPSEVKTATYEMVLSMLNKADDPSKEDPLLGFSQLKLASLSLTTKPDQGGSISSTVNVIPEKVKKILSDYRSLSSFGVVRLMRG